MELKKFKLNFTIQGKKNTSKIHLIEFTIVIENQHFLFFHFFVAFEFDKKK